MSGQLSRMRRDVSKATGETEVTVLTPEQREEWRQTLLPVHKEVEARIGKDLIQQVYKTTGFGGAKWAGKSFPRRREPGVVNASRWVPAFAG